MLSLNFGIQNKCFADLYFTERVRSLLQNVVPYFTGGFLWILIYIRMHLYCTYTILNTTYSGHYFSQVYFLQFLLKLARS